jgi:hypothetical protein
VPAGCPSSDWDTVTEGSQPITAGIGLNVSLEGQPAGTYRVVVDSTQSGYPGLFWTTNYNALTVRVHGIPAQCLAVVNL